MKKNLFVTGLLIVGSSLFAECTDEVAANTQGKTTQVPSCTQLTPKEQNFASQIVDQNNKKVFCSQFTASQRRQAMQRMGQPDGSGNRMTADEAIEEVMASTGSPPASNAKPRAGGCPAQ